MPDNPLTAIGKLEILHRGKESLGLEFDRLRKQPARAAAKDIRQWIIKLVGLTKANNVDSLVHGVSLLWRFGLASTTAPIRRPTQTVITQFPP